MDRYHRRSIRLPDYDYSQDGAYFVTICAHDRACILSRIVEGAMQLNSIGRIVDESWQWLFRQYPHVVYDSYVIIPNHLHAIMIITDDPRRGGSRTAPTINRKPLGRLIGAFKTVSTKNINLAKQTPGRIIWQRNYYEHVIRNERSMEEIREYIRLNPFRWSQDEENPDRAMK